MFLNYIFFFRSGQLVHCTQLQVCLLKIALLVDHWRNVYRIFYLFVFDFNCFKIQSYSFNIYIYQTWFIMTTFNWILFNKFPTFHRSLFCISTMNCIWSDFILTQFRFHSSFNCEKSTIRFLYKQNIQFFFFQNHWINPLSSCLNMDQGSHPIIYTCTLCNIWTVAKNRYQVTRCMRCSNPLKLIEVCIAFTCCSYLDFLAVQLYTVSKILFSLFDFFFITEKRGEAKAMVVYKTQMSVLFLASFEGSIWIDKDKKKYLHCNNQKNNNQ